MAFVILAVLVWKFVDFIRLLSNYEENKSGIATQLIAWVSGIIIVIFAAHASFTREIVLPGTDQVLARIGFVSQFLLGLFVGSFASGIVDIKQAIDRSDSAAKPQLEFRLPEFKRAPSIMDEEVPGTPVGEYADTTIWVGSSRAKEKQD